MSTAEEFTNQRFSTPLMSRPGGNLEASMIANHAACSLLSRSMQLFYQVPVLVPHVPDQGKRRAARRLSLYPTLLAASFFGLRAKSRLLQPLRHVPCNLTICIACSFPGNRRARSGFVAYFSSISGGLNILVSQRIYSDLSLRSSYLFGSK
jgi:hypothetical protein